MLNKLGAKIGIRIFMDEYERLAGIGYADVESWIDPIAARKLSADGISEDEKNYW
ncbi:hypothetical protein H9647_10945 [Paenibacillus sp. Sa2BVA9]|uniref:Uncharacterized protein n=1 Tax=Paenibacillus gallinarum TaxID=2762232 RepID=A0ABR8SZ10_9BACL|nr:hypothetical protein [Paenibacillus gallinarum]